MLDYESLSTVAAVIREGSFERAAGTLGVTPSAVSQRVRLLEERLGAILVTRGHPCTATATGAQLCAHVERVRLLESEMVTSLPELAAEAGNRQPITVSVAVNADSLGTWFLPAVAAFSSNIGTLVNLVVDDEEHTIERLRSGEVLAAVTADVKPVQGCRNISLGALRYIATASPTFVQRHFPHGVDAVSLAQAPMLRFNLKDRLALRWGLDGAGAELSMPAHWVPSTQGFVDAALVGLGWGISPLSLVEPHIAAGHLTSIWPDRWLDVPLYWQHARLGARLLNGLTREVVAAANRSLISPARPALRQATKARQPGLFNAALPARLSPNCHTGGGKQGC